MKHSTFESKCLSLILIVSETQPSLFFNKSNHFLTYWHHEHVRTSVMNFICWWSIVLYYFSDLFLCRTCFPITYVHSNHSNLHLLHFLLIYIFYVIVIFFWNLLWLLTIYKTTWPYNKFHLQRLMSKKWVNKMSLFLQEFRFLKLAHFGSCLRALLQKIFSNCTQTGFLASHSYFALTFH